MKNILIGDTDCVNYNPSDRIDVILEDILPRIKANLCRVTVWYIMKLEAKTWSLASKVPNISEKKLLAINSGFRSLNVDHLRSAVIEELHKRQMKQTKLEDWLVAYE